MRTIEPLVAAIVLLAWCTLGTQARPLTGGVVDLVFNVENLMFSVEDLSAKVQSVWVHETPSETRIELPADILFDFDKADIRAIAELALKRAAALIRKDAHGMTVIAGHTDAIGSPAYNEKLSEQRSAAVLKWLVERKGLDGARFQAKVSVPRVRLHRTQDPMAPTTRKAASATDGWRLSSATDNTDPQSQDAACCGPVAKASPRTAPS
jgi:OmpA family